MERGRMHKPFDRFGKSLAGRFMELWARLELECEVQHAVQSVDIAFEPDGRVPEVPLGGWLGRIAIEGPGVLECFSHTVRADEVEACIYKRDGLYQARSQRARQDGQPRPERPCLWITSPGRPREVMRKYDAEPEAGWPPGFWGLRRGLGLYVVVISELPEIPDTLVLRLLGRDATLRQAILECTNLEQGSPMQRRIKPLLVAFESHILQDLKRDADDPERDTDMNVLEEVQAMYSRWEQETVDRGRKEGRKEGHKEGRKEGHKEGRKEGLEEGERAALLRLLERRFGALPEALTARVADASTNEIESWLDRVLDASSLDDVFAG
jgi:Domain of unknown function (DUF4351)